MTEQRIAKQFGQKVQMLVDDDNERELLYRALKSYKQIMSVERLVSDLKKVLNTPKRMILYEEIRPLIPLKHQLIYDRSVPKLPSERLRVIRLVKQGQKKESFGFSVRGGVEHGVGIFVSEVVADSQASNKGLKVGDQLVRVNGFNISQATHDEVLALVNSKRIVTLKVKTVGMIPIKNNKNDPVTWKYIENASILDDMITNVEHVTDSESNIRKLYVNLDGGMSLGCSIASSPGRDEIYIQYVKAGSLAEKIGIKPGDQILDVNDVSFVGISHSEAVMVLKSSKQLTIHLKEGAAAESGFDIYAKPQRSVRPQRDQQEQEELMKLRQLALEREREKQQRLDIERAEAEKLQKEELLKHQRLEVEHPPQQKQEKTNIENEERWRRVSRTSVDTDKESEMIAQELLEVSLHQEQIEHQKSLSLQDQWNAEREEIERQMEIESKRTVLPQETDAQNFTSTMKVHLTSESYAKNRQTRDDTDSQFNARKLFTDREIGGREIRVLKIKKDGPLEILIEGGLDSPIGKCVVSEVYEGGAAWRHGGLFKGDQIMMVDGKKTADAKLAEAEEILKDAMKNTDGTGTLELVIALAPPKNYEDEITFF